MKKSEALLSPWPPPLPPPFAMAAAAATALGETYIRRTPYIVVVLPSDI